MDTIWTILGGAGTFLNYAGYPATVIVIGTAIWRLILWGRGISPALRGLGNGLAKRKIAIFAKGENVDTLQHALLRSELFRKENLLTIQNAANLGTCDDASVYLVYWPDWSTHIDRILEKKDDRIPLVIYCPAGCRIPPDEMEKIDGHRNTAVSNFRGRLLNDVVTAMITTKL